MEQAVLPPHAAVQPPFAHLRTHVLVPSHVAVEPVSSVSVQVLPPEQVTVLLIPVSIVHWLVPAQVDVQFELHVPSQTDCPAQLVVHPVPHVDEQVFFDWQSYVTLFGGPASTAALLGALPNVQVPPCWHVHVLPVQTQSPVQPAVDGGGGGLSLPPHPAAAMLVTAPVASAPSTPRVSERRARSGFSMTAPPFGSGIIVPEGASRVRWSSS
jgi:hypothetical protein